MFYVIIHMYIQLSYEFYLQKRFYTSSIGLQESHQRLAPCRSVALATARIFSSSLGVDSPGSWLTIVLASPRRWKSWKPPGFWGKHRWTMSNYHPGKTRIGIFLCVSGFFSWFLSYTLEKPGETYHDHYPQSTIHIMRLAIVHLSWDDPKSQTWNFYKFLLGQPSQHLASPCVGALGEQPNATA